MTPFEELLSRETPERAAEAAAYHKAPRRYLGLTTAELAELVQGWRDARSVEERVALADELWQSDVHEARMAAAKLLVQARIRPDAGVWALICAWVPQLDAWAIADAVTDAGARRLVADPTRLDEVEAWTGSEHLWSRRAALEMTRPWAKLSKVKPEDLAIRERVLAWAETYTTDRDWFIQKSLADWLRDLSKHDPERSRLFLEEHGEKMKRFARKEAGQHLG
ncbi:DNA alkylation repair protein [Xinfangfangia sp. CPCC 101601]|uniref:DNA alkylation repair protein n=1 Tax=Pseudogemmobacter lacusdianii TaxID=3069608 RepID=A0ABU0VY53_9RHOB|nr:DNA alkylation repair protein [Xinfangfangia sp. CPCC 101601]MDQ2066687.1 DNA alkylation repair protein [Xinfangfangia sp. CPCC 101601]